MTDKVLVFHQPFPWSVWIMYPDTLKDPLQYKQFQKRTMRRLLTMIPASDITEDPEMGTGCYYCFRLKNEHDIALVKMMFS